MEALNQISPSDLSLFTKANANAQSAQSILQFTRMHLGEVYQIGEQDQVNLQTGEITRFKPPAAGVEGAPAAAKP